MKIKDKLQKNWKTIIAILLISLSAGIAQVLIKESLKQEVKNPLTSPPLGELEIKENTYYANGTITFTVLNHYSEEIIVTQAEVLSGETSLIEGNKTAFINLVKASDSIQRRISGNGKNDYYLQKLPALNQGEYYVAKVSITYLLRGKSVGIEKNLEGTVS